MTQPMPNWNYGSVRGRSRQDAEANASNMVYNVAQNDSALIFDEDLSLWQNLTVPRTKPENAALSALRQNVQDDA